MISLSNLRSHRRILFFAFVAALAAGGCTTQVAVGPNQQGTQVASYDNMGTLTGQVPGDLATVFHASNRALDGLGYFRVGQRIDPEKGTPMKEAYILARGAKDRKIEVDITPAKSDGVSAVNISLSPSDLPTAETILSAILSQVNSTGGGSPANLSPPSR